MRILGRNNFFLKNATTVETISKVNTLVFDKTGTITQQGAERISWEGTPLTNYQQQLLRNLALHPIHPKSKMIAEYLSAEKPLHVLNFKERVGLGVEAIIDHKQVKLGSKDFIKHQHHSQSADESRVYASVNDHFLGWFRINNVIRDGLKEQVDLLRNDYELFLLSGDNGCDKLTMQTLFPENDHLLFTQTPSQKLQFIQQLQQTDRKVMMIGDGLNDAGALQQSDIGVAVTDDLHQFSPACDVIMKGSEISRFEKFIRFCKSGMNIVWLTFIISLLYNIIGIYFAVRGELSPMVAAILMPLSSLSVIFITTIASKLKARQLGFLQ